MKKKSVFSCLLLVLLTSCSQDSFIRSDKIKVMVEDSELYTVDSPIREILPGSDVSFTIRFLYGSSFLSCSYPSYSVEKGDGTKCTLTLKDVFYPSVISLSCSKGSLTYHSSSSLFLDGTDTRREPFQGYHLREHALDGYEVLNGRDGYLLSSWNTEEDLSGEDVYFNNRVPYGVKDLYPHYEKVSPLSDFTFSVDADGACVTSYKGKDDKVVLPSSYNGSAVYKISTGAFSSSSLKELYLPSSVKRIEKDAFLNSSLEEMTFADSLNEIDQNAFKGSPLKTVHINAVTPPHASGTYYDAFTDKIDYLDSVRGEKKIVLFGGSSVRYGYYSPLFEEAFSEYKTVDMGVFAYVNMKPQLSVIASYMNPGDILIHAPEYDYWALDEQFGTDRKFEENLFYFFEGNYASLSLIDIQDYPDFFFGYTHYQRRRSSLASLDYSYTSNHRDDDFNYHQEKTYNLEGDYILEREGHDRDEHIYQPLTPYTLETITEDRISNLNSIYQSLSQKGIRVFYAYAPKNHKAITDESTYEKRNELEAYLQKHLSVPILGKLEDSLYPGTSFYLIDNHLSSKAAKGHTEYVINELRKVIG